MQRLMSVYYFCKCVGQSLVRLNNNISLTLWTSDAQNWLRASSQIASARKVDRLKNSKATFRALRRTLPWWLSAKRFHEFLINNRIKNKNLELELAHLDHINCLDDRHQLHGWLSWCWPLRVWLPRWSSWSTGSSTQVNRFKDTKARSRPDVLIFCEIEKSRKKRASRVPWGFSVVLKTFKKSSSERVPSECSKSPIYCWYISKRYIYR